MWGALVRQLVAYVLTRRGKKVIAFVGTMLLLFVTALLLDTQLYLTAGFTGLLAAATVLSWAVNNIRQRHRDRERERLQLEEALRRAAAAAARGEKMDKARSTFTGAARTVTGGAANVVGAARSGISATRDKLKFWKRRNPHPAPANDPGSAT